MDTSEKSKAIERRGGSRPGAGRKPGTPYRSSIQGAKSLRERFPVFPLDYMLAVLNDSNASDDRRDQMARAAAPYIHPRLASFDINGPRGEARTTMDLTKLSDAELDELERMIAKAQSTVTTIDSDDPLLDLPTVEYDESGYSR